MSRRQAKADKLRAEIVELRLTVGLAHAEVRRMREERDAARSDLDKLMKAIQSLRRKDNGES
jgi:uncharacterized coiled-coil DUF342 family protein